MKNGIASLHPLKHIEVIPEVIPRREVKEVIPS